ncbi:MAG: hypothetical protein A2504_09655 [Bdellovibrionales bacterium RIFOXYD12_FULL_39_22]|nr:MAG: hypothetical protein A2385_13145 [Bdellovibrionales bacterium RIFOXYB1_FULL_39_21]OFZ40992.1 MAG: hypothetical protein A2485_16655 [Bdellovibrionales bacterium RIFOXYC12_FULL_39_17]OFZ44820.1 MAG: hypothetical protein A2404_09945 [Bdellovibrionales bacterium RIFOXYC1_FULL_39_130]OFZ74285.1 MAG: hypothetical protein A2560_16910 [Bdellovibrionales bacterium RIFOXYD1_FULL_39_84]OFZ92149.1 MAG: hypothetical protein A2504_09655 [Bdellovibrionales bacterium RIFOXYD12_FULL_39_22]HLE12747.1 cu
MKITTLKETASVEMKMEGAVNVLKQVPLSKNDGAPHFSFRVFTIGINGHTPYHQHEVEHLNYVISGNGALVRQGGQETPIGTGSFAMVLPGEMHQYKNLSQHEPLVVICAVPKEYE